ncbi:preprotein translocase subunit SecY [bacterium]|nr:preprotein translocase subunit SecY [bacterium]
MQKVKLFFSKVMASDELKRKFGFTLLIFVCARFLANVPLPFINTAALSSMFQQYEFLSFLNIVAGGTLASLSLVAVGISPYITASIIIQLLTFIWPSLKQLQKDGEKGRLKLNQYTRLLSLPVAIVQSFSIIAILRSSNLLTAEGLGVTATLIFFLTVGSFMMLWLSELIGAYGIGNGTSMMMLLGIVSQLPTTFAQFDSLASSDLGGTGWFKVVILFLSVLAVVAVVVLMDQSVRKVPIQYARRIQGNRQIGGQTTFFPIKLNAVGVMPIIFAVTIMSIPSFVGSLLTQLEAGSTWYNVGRFLTETFSRTSPWYICIYFAIVFIFSYFSALLFFDTQDISDELKKSGAFIPGIRPGQHTQKFLETVMKRLTFVDGIFLSCIAVLPFILGLFLPGAESISIGGTSLLIAVSVLLEINKTVEGTAVEQNYDQYLD